jgi:hypothetical protein
VRGAEQIGRSRPRRQHPEVLPAGGGVVTDAQPVWQGFTSHAAGALDDDPGIRPVAHIFAASKASWVDITDDIPRFDAFPTGVDATVLPEVTPPVPAGKAPRGSCLCGGVAFVVEGTAMRAYDCHCSRCRKARGSAFASNLFTAIDGVRILQGEDLLESYKVPEARHFTTVFCRRCGSKMPRFSPERGIAIVPMGAFDDDPGFRPQRHIYVGSKAPWYDITDDLPQDTAAPTSS